MSFFHHPNPTKLAENNDLHGLVNCVTAKDQATARKAAPLLAALVDEFDEAPGTREVIRDLESDAQPMSVHALTCVVRHGFERNSHVKSSAALALYRLRAGDELRNVLRELRGGPHAGNTLHATLSHDLLGAAIRARDVAMVQFLLVHGQFTNATEVAAAFDLLRSGGTEAVERVVGDPAIFSSVVKEAGLDVLGRGAQQPPSQTTPQTPV